MQNSPVSLSFPALKSRAVSLSFDGGDVTSDAGLALIALADRKLGITAALTTAFQDRRQARKVDHPAGEIITARVYAIAQGYEDGNDFDRLRHDPGLKTVCGHLPASGRPLTSQETLSRFEHAPTAKDLIRMGRALADQVVAQLPSDSTRVWIDVDPYDDPCHGHQQLSLFNGFYNAHCYLPLAVCVTGGDGVQRIVGVVLRPGNAAASTGLATVLRGLVKRIRGRCPQAQLILRGDSGFGIAAVLTLCERLSIDSVLGVARNAVLQELGTPVQMDAALKYRWAGDGCREFGEFTYGARSWTRKCRVIIKAEITQGALNPRYVVTSLTEETPEDLYLLYCARGDRENRWKEFKIDLAAGRTSCTTFLANQARILWHVAAYILCLAIREAAVGTEWATAQVSTLRSRLFKIGAKIVETCRKVWWHLPTSCPVQQVWARVFQQLC